MICHVPERLSISAVAFLPASPGEIADGFLGWVTCLVKNSLRLAPMRVRLLRDGTIRIKVRQGGIDLYAGSVSLADASRQEIHALIEASPAFQAGLAAIWIERGCDA